MPERRCERICVPEEPHGDKLSKISYRLDALPGASYSTHISQSRIPVGGVREIAHGVPKGQPKVIEPRKWLC